MPNGNDHTREYGGHKYPDIHTTNDCEHGCGCWAGPTRSGGPLGLDPLKGECPNNPICGERLSDKEDYEIVVVRRIRNLEKRACDAEGMLEDVAPGEIKLVEDLRAAERIISEQRNTLRETHEAIGKVLVEGEEPDKDEEPDD